MTENLRCLIAVANSTYENGDGWNAKRDAEQALKNWRDWLPALLDKLEMKA